MSQSEEPWIDSCARYAGYLFVFEFARFGLTWRKPRAGDQANRRQFLHSLVSQGCVLEPLLLAGVQDPERDSCGHIAAVRHVLVI